MLIGGFSLNNLSFHSGPRASGSTARTSSASSSVDQDTRIHRQLGELEKALDRLDVALRRSQPGAPARVRSASNLGLDQVSRYTTLTSSAEVNTTPTSYSPFGPSISGTSTSLVTVDGVYDGSLGDDVLTFTVKQGGTVTGGKNMRLEVRSSSNALVDQVQLGGNDPAGTEYLLSSGLRVSFSDGTRDKNDTFPVAVSATTGSAVDPTKPFDGTRNDRPNFEYGTTVTAGSFDVNDVTIDVLASDSIQTVLDRINASEAGVTGAFDALTETITLTRTTEGPLDIAFANDTSGFLSATKLAGATPVLGELKDSDKVMADVAALSGVTAGTIRVNGVDIAIDPSVDSLSDVLARMELTAGVNATLDEAGPRVDLVNRDRTRTLTLDDGGTGLFAALEITVGQHDPSRRAVSPERVSRAMKDVASSLNAIFTDSESEKAGARLVRVRRDLHKVFGEAFGEDGDRIRSDFGVHLDFRAADGGVFDWSQSAATRLRSAIRRNGQEVFDVFLGRSRSKGDGLIAALLERISAVRDEIRSGSTGKGLNLSTSA